MWIWLVIGIIIGAAGLIYGFHMAGQTEMSNEVIKHERQLIRDDIALFKGKKEELEKQYELLQNEHLNEQRKLEATREAVQEISNQQYNLNNELTNLNARIQDAENRKKILDTEFETASERLSKVNNLIAETIQTQQEPIKAAKEEYLNALEQTYNNAEQQYDLAITILDQAYEMKQDTILKAISDLEAAAASRESSLAHQYNQTKKEYEQSLVELKEELDKIKATRAAVIEAMRKEQMIKEQQSFYCLQMNDLVLSDINHLNEVKKILNNPRILSMLIWSTYFQKPMTALCNNILGTGQICGIYKITNLNNNMCYIGQAVNVADRWKQHAKCGLNIDTPVGNKLYKAMIEEGIQNFSWELLEECPRDQLNEKEKYYIELYDSVNYGYNIVHGIVKGN